jgi:hypothetical protein
MRDDFAKQLTERERVHHADHYHNYRHVKGPKGLTDDEVGGRESMRKRYNHGYDRKHFNENLNPLKGWLHSCIGKKWDKCYSELRKKFDARKVVNNHILEHLYQYIQIHTKVVDGQVMALQRWSDKGYVPVKEISHDYYVCPRDGTVKVTHKQPRRSLIKQKEAEQRQKQLAVERYLDSHNVLRFIDGVWYHFELKPIPKAQIIYVKPEGVDVFKTGYQFLGTPNSRREKTWDELNESERQRHGKAKVVGETARDLFTNEVVYCDQKGTVHLGKNWIHNRLRQGFLPQKLYHATKATASHKQLKQVGLAD